MNSPIPPDANSAIPSTVVNGSPVITPDLAQDVSGINLSPSGWPVNQTVDFAANGAYSTVESVSPKDQVAANDSELLLANVVDTLEKQGYVIFHAPFSSADYASLQTFITQISDYDFKPAGIGRAEKFQIDGSQRSDAICWLTGNELTLQGYFDWMEKIRVAMNGSLFLGLFDYECHFAIYRKGDFYKKHIDAFRGLSNRRLSTVLYLNDDWNAGDGGELVIYDPNSGEPIEKVLPQRGKMVLFLSEVFPHEVLPAGKERLSLTGWFRVNGNIAGQIDPPA